MATTIINDTHLTNIANAIRNKNGTTDTYKPSEMAGAIENIETGGSGGGKYAPRKLSFQSYAYTDELDYEIANVDTSNLLTMSSMFQYCSTLLKADLKGWITSNVQSFYNMFYHCEKITEINFDSFDFTNATTCEGMLSYCYKIKKIDLSCIKENKITTFKNMFLYSHDIEEIDLSNMKTTSVTNTTTMFGECTSLKKLDIRSATFSKITSSSNYTRMFSGVPADCEIIVKDDTQKAWITSKFTTLTNVKTVAELEAA